MSLVAKLAFQFNRSSQFKGLELQQRGKVKVISSSGALFQAQVQGGNLYCVSIRKENDKLRMACQCIAFADFGYCKHVWAALLEADRRGAFSALRGVAQLQAAADYELLREWERSGVEWKHAAPSRVPAWQIAFDSVQRQLEVPRIAEPHLPRGSEILYAVNAAASAAQKAIVLELFTRTPKKNGGMSVYKPLHASASLAETLTDKVDAELIMLLLGGQDYYDYSYYGSSSGQTRKCLSTTLALKLFPQAASAGRLGVRERNEMHFQPLLWDDGVPWAFRMEVRRDGPSKWAVTGALKREGETMALEEASLVLEHFLIAHGKLARLDCAGSYGWLTHLQQVRSIPFDERDREAVIAKLLSSQVLPPLDMDEELRFHEEQGQPRFGLRLKQSQYNPQSYFEGRLIVDYGRGWFEDPVGAAGIWVPEERLFLTRDRQTEQSARLKLTDLGLTPLQEGRSVWKVTVSAMPRIVRELLAEGWHVEADGKAFRRAGKTSMAVRSGIDWFELHGQVDYEGTVASLPELLGALRRGDNMVRLGDGSFGLLPEEWLARFAPLAAMGSDAAGHLRFGLSQAGLLDALLAAQPEVQVDEVFARLRDRIRGFGGITALPQPEGFQGHLREYQREGLGWMEFLREFGFGGCLADDMGVGKTAQVLAMLESRRHLNPGASLVVAPRSLMFNWRAEAEKFTPELRVVEHTGTSRDVEAIRDFDIVLTTYGTLLRDAPRLAETEFDYVILDEAQAIKNASTASSKAVRLMKSRHRLALSGTPVENHLGELWSLFEFLNPGMLGHAKMAEHERRPRAQSQRGGPSTSCPCAATLHSPPHETAGRPRAPGKDRADHLL